jgi:CheY-like chemotaxis protein
MSKNMTKQLNILLADDDMDDCQFFKDALAALHLKTQLKIVNDGEALMTYLSENGHQLPDVLFLDLNMPRKNGFECLTELKDNVQLKDIPVVIFSTSFPKAIIDMVFKMGANLYIRKPGDFGQLKQVIYNALPIAIESHFSKGSLKYILNA